MALRLAARKQSDRRGECKNRGSSDLSVSIFFEKKAEAGVGCYLCDKWSVNHSASTLRSRSFFHAEYINTYKGAVEKGFGWCFDGLLDVVAGVSNESPTRYEYHRRTSNGPGPTFWTLPGCTNEWTDLFFVVRLKTDAITCPMNQLWVGFGDGGGAPLYPVRCQLEHETGSGWRTAIHLSEKTKRLVMKLGVLSGENGRPVPWINSGRIQFG